MKVFYFMMLVLAAGVVPSHGRTESEATVFNNTRPHEILDNVTVSSSKVVVTFDLLYLVLTWPQSYCNSLDVVDTQCRQPVPGRFTVHGLWPQSSGSGIDCRDRRRYGGHPPFDGRLLDGLVPDLNIYWPDLKTGENDNYWFWRYEYVKHGSCTFNKQYSYFNLTLFLVKRVFPRLSQIIQGRRFVPGNSYRSNVIRNVVFARTGLWPRLSCVEVENRVLLLEIRFCAYRNRNGIQLGSCGYKTDCNNAEVYLPYPRPLRP